MSWPAAAALLTPPLTSLHNSRCLRACVPQDIIGRFPDLMEGFNRFLARCETMDAVDNEMRGQFGSQRGISAREMARLKGVSAR